MFLLRRMSKLWSQNPPPANWRNECPKFQEYAEGRIRDSNKIILKSNRPPDEAELHECLVAAKDPKAPNHRHIYRIIGEMLLRPIFEESAESWDALGFLGQASTRPPVSLTDYSGELDFEFNKWLQVVPEHLKDLVVRIGKKIGD